MKSKKKLNYVILYKDHRYEIIREDKLDPRKLASNTIEFIMVPCIDRENVYIPMKPSGLYDFHHAHVHIEYRVFFYDMEDMVGDDLLASTYESDCSNPIDLANALFNLYKFRGASIFIAENLNVDTTTFTYTVYPTKIRVDFYNASDTIFITLKSKNYSSFKDHDPMKFQAYPPQYCWEDRFVCLSDLMYVPLVNPYSQIEPGTNGLYTMISIQDDCWSMISNYNKALKQDYVFHKIYDFEAYYFMTGDVMRSLDQAQFHTWDVSMITIPIMTNEEKYVDRQKTKVDIKTKAQLYHDYVDENIYSIFSVRCSMDTMVDFVTIYGFLHIIVAYLSYFTQLVYAHEEIQDVLGFVLFETHRRSSDFDPNIMLVDQELSPDSLAKIILYLIERSKRS